jgi:hypothetical protein
MPTRRLTAWRASWAPGRSTKMRKWAQSSSDFAYAPRASAGPRGIPFLDVAVGIPPPRMWRRFMMEAFGLYLLPLPPARLAWASPYARFFVSWWAVGRLDVSQLVLRGRQALADRNLKRNRKIVHGFSILLLIPHPENTKERRPMVGCGCPTLASQRTPRQSGKKGRCPIIDGEWQVPLSNPAR